MKSSCSMADFPSCKNVASCFYIKLAERKLSFESSSSPLFKWQSPLLCQTSQSSGLTDKARSYVSIAFLCFPVRNRDRPSCLRQSRLMGSRFATIRNWSRLPWISPRERKINPFTKHASSRRLLVSSKASSITRKHSSCSPRVYSV